MIFCLALSINNRNNHIMNKLKISLFFLLFLSQIYATAQQSSESEPSAAIQVIQLSFVQPEELIIETANPEIDMLAGQETDLFGNFEVTGGVPPYHLQLTVDDEISVVNGAEIVVNPSDTTIYQLTVFDSNGCSADAFCNVNVIHPLQVVSTLNNVNCHGMNNGSVSLEVTYGVPPYTFEWSNGAETFEITGLMAGIYHATVTDSVGQVYQGGYRITEPDKIETFIEDTICSDEAYLVGSKSYREAGNYIDTLTTAMGCDSILHLSLTVNPLPEIPTITILGDTLISSADIKQWFYDNGTLIDGATHKQYMIESSGAYYVVAYNQYGCSMFSDLVSVTKTSVAHLTQPLFDCLVYPNPNNGLFTLQLTTNSYTNHSVRLFSIDGKLISSEVLSVSETETKKPMEFNHLSQGVYYLQISNGQNSINKKIIIQ
jgi:hypothetical protein